MASSLGKRYIPSRTDNISYYTIETRSNLWRVASRSHLWDCYWGCVVKMAAIFAPSNGPTSDCEMRLVPNCFSFLRWRIAVRITRKKISIDWCALIDYLILISYTWKICKIYLGGAGIAGERSPSTNVARVRFRPGVICRLSLLSVLILAPVFLPQQKPTFLNYILFYLLTSFGSSINDILYSCACEGKLKEK